MKTQENNLILPSLTCQFEFQASVNQRLFSGKFPFNLSFCCPAECGVGWRFSLCKYINSFTALETVIQCQPDHEFCPSNIKPVYIFHPKGRNWLVCKWQRGLGMQFWQVPQVFGTHPVYESQIRESRSREPQGASRGCLVHLFCPHDFARVFEFQRADSCSMWHIFN